VPTARSNRVALRRFGTTQSTPSMLDPSGSRRTRRHHEGGGTDPLGASRPIPASVSAACVTAQVLITTSRRPLAGAPPERASSPLSEGLGLVLVHSAPERHESHRPHVVPSSPARAGQKVIREFRELRGKQINFQGPHPTLSASGRGKQSATLVRII
jgi:hypothetical protein